MRALNTEIFPVKVGYFGTCSKPINLTSGFTIFSRNDLWRHKTAFLNRVLWRVRAISPLPQTKPTSTYAHVAWSVFLWRFSYRGRMGWFEPAASWILMNQMGKILNLNSSGLGRCGIHCCKVTVNLAFFNAFVMSNHQTWVCVYRWQSIVYNCFMAGGVPLITIWLYRSN